MVMEIIADLSARLRMPAIVLEQLLERAGGRPRLGLPGGQLLVHADLGGGTHRDRLVRRVVTRRLPDVIETRLRDITRLPTDDLDGASLITASALLDMMTSHEISRTVASISAARCPALITLTARPREETA